MEPWRKGPNGGVLHAASDQFDKLLTETAGNFLDIFVRQHLGRKQAQKALQKGHSQIALKHIPGTLQNLHRSGSRTSPILG